MKLNFFRSCILLTGIALIAFGCKKTYEGIEVLDEQNIQAYLKQNNLNMQEYDTTGIYYKVLTPGTGDSVRYTDVVYVTFTMKSLDGKYNSTDEYTANRYSNFLGYLDPANSGLPVAFRTAIHDLLKHKGGEIRIIIPSRLAYGRNGSSNIPGNASLDCTLRLYDVNSQAAFDDTVIDKFATSNNLNLTKDTSGLYYQIITPGTGTVAITDTTEITTLYKLSYLNGSVVQETSADDPYVTTPAENIEGFRIGVSLIKKGGKIRLIIPSRLGYGSSPSNGIRSNAILDYEVEVTDVTE